MREERERVCVMSKVLRVDCKTHHKNKKTSWMELDITLACQAVSIITVKIEWLIVEAN